MKLRTLSILLALLMLFSSVSCSDNSTPSDSDSANANDAGTVTETAEQEKAQQIIDNLPADLDFGGESIQIIAEEGGNGPLTEKSLFVEEDTGDVVDSAVFNRNIKVADRLNITLEDAIIEKGNAVPQLIRTAATADSDEYDIIGLYQYTGAGFCSEGLIYDLTNLDYLDLEAEYWGVDYINDMSFKGMKFWATGDLALRYTGGMYVSYINQTIWNNHFTGTNVYDVAFDGKWTLDYVYGCTETVYTDTNGNAERDSEDIYGLILSFQDPIDGFAAGSKVNFSEFNSDGIPVLTLANERTYAFYEKMYQLTNNNTGMFVTPEDDSYTIMTMFAAERGLMTMNKLFLSEIYLRDMNSGFAVLPVPKLDESQEHYNTRLHDGVTIFGIPITNKNTAASSATLEAMAAESYLTVAPAYYDVALKTKYTRDSESGKMIDLVRENISADFVSIYSKSIKDIAWIFRTNLGGGRESVSSTFARMSQY